jgi:hypothetical protein
VGPEADPGASVLNGWKNVPDKSSDVGLLSQPLAHTHLVIFRGDALRNGGEHNRRGGRGWVTGAFSLLTGRPLGCC